MFKANSDEWSEVDEADLQQYLDSDAAPDYTMHKRFGDYLIVCERHSGTIFAFKNTATGKCFVRTG